VKHLLVLGAGTAGTMAVAKLRPRLPASEWRISVVDRDDEHHYQPGYLFVPFGVYDRADVVRPRSRYLPEGVDLVLGEIAAIEHEG
jgi:sulfide:quinone oxidoreductase